MDPDHHEDEHMDEIEDDEEDERMPENMEEVPDESWITLKSHQKDVFTLTVSKDGTQLLSGGEDDKAVVWDLTQLGLVDEIPRHEVPGHADSVVSVGYNGSNTLFSTADMSGKIQIFDVQAGKHLYDIEYCDDLEWTVWHPQADILLAGSSQGQIFMFLLSKTQIEKVKTYATETNSPCSAARLLPGAQSLLAIYEDGKALLWNLKDATHTACNLRSPCTAIDVHPELPLAAVGTQSGVTHIINTTNMSSVSKLGSIEAKTDDSEEPSEESVETVKFAPGFPWIAVGSANGMLILYDYETGRGRIECSHDNIAVVKSVWWRPAEDQIRILSACFDGGIRCWDAKTGNPLLFKCGAGEQVFDVTIASVNNQPLVFAACAEGDIRVYKYEESELETEEPEAEEEVLEAIPEDPQ